MKSLTDYVSEISVAYLPTTKKKQPIVTVYDAYRELFYWFPKETISLQERFLVAYLNRSSRVIGVYEVSKGGMSGTVVDIRLVLATALKVAATGMILAHNHPSGNIQPSKKDKELTCKMQHAASWMDIKVIDHLIVSAHGEYFSFSEHGLLHYGTSAIV